MRVTLDTNVLVSAFISKRGTSADILDIISTFEEITLVLSDGILQEFADVMSREEVLTRFDYSKTEISKFENAIRGVAEIVAVRSNFRAVKEDPDDDMVVNAAIDGRADYIVSNDRHLRKLRRVKGVRVITPKMFMTLVTKNFGGLILSKDDLEE